MSRRPLLPRRLLGVVCAIGVMTFLAVYASPVRAANPAVVTGTSDVAVEAVTWYADPANPAYVYYVCEIRWTNFGRQDRAPRIERFVLTAANQVRYPGLQTGALPLIGIVNARAVVQHGGVQHYTVGYHVPIDTVGSIAYDQT